MGINGIYVMRTLPLWGENIKWNRARRTRAFQEGSPLPFTTILELSDAPRDPGAIRRQMESLPRNDHTPE